MEAYLKLRRSTSYFSLAVNILGAVLFSDWLLHAGSFLAFVISIFLFFSGLFFFLIATSAQNDIGAKNQRTAKKSGITEKRFGFMIEHAIDIISLLDEKNKIVYINEAITKITGYTVPEVLSMPLSKLIHPDDRAESANTFVKLHANPGIHLHRTARMIHKNGSEIFVEGILVNLLHDENVKGIVSNYRDVTARKLAEDRAHASEKKFRNTLDKMMEGIQIIDFDWRYIYVNESVSKHGRYSETELVGHTMMEKYPGIEHSEMFKTLEKCMHDRTAKMMDNEFLYPDGTKGWFELSIQPVPEGIFILSIDISERKKNEEALQKLQGELEHKVIDRTEQLQNANDELEAFSYSVSHDLRAPLRAVNGYAKMIEEDYARIFDDEGKRLLKAVQDNANKMGNLIDDLLNFSRLGRKELQKTEIHMQELVNDVLAEINKSLPHKAHITVHAPHSLNADYTLLTQVMHNLLTNAIKYSSKKEQPQIEIRSEEKEGQFIFHVRDNGAGFDMQYIDKLFGVFQRLHTADEFEGTGVGLAIVQRIISKHGGKVWAEGNPGKGATFYFALPHS